MQATLKPSKIDVSLDAILQQWKIARSSLLAPIHHYESTCVSLVEFCAGSEMSTLRFQTNHPVLSDVHNEIRILEEAQAMLENSKKRLLRVKNQHAYINRLPPEILVNIFDIVVQTSSYGSSYFLAPQHAPHPKTYSALLSVCSCWRNAMINTSQLWTHISYDDYDRCPDTSLERARLWIQRAGSAPLRVRINVNMPYADEYTVKADVLSLLNSCAKNVHSLDLSVQPSINLGPIVSHWLSNGNSGSVDGLKPQEFAQPNGTGSFEQDSSPPKEYFPPLRKLHFVYANVEWKHVRLSELADLRLKFSIAPSVHAFVTMLSSTPKLRNLKLDVADVVPSATDNTTTTLVRLEHLSALTLSYALRGFLRDLLRAITPGSDGMSLCITHNQGFQTEVEEVTEAIKCFIRDANITALWLWHDIVPSDLRECLAYSPNLEMLVIERRDFNDADWRAIFSQHNSFNFPKLQSLVLNGCTFPHMLASLETLRQHPTIQRLELADCSILTDSNEVFHAYMLEDLNPDTGLYRSFCEVVGDVCCYEIFDGSRLGFV